MRDLSCRWVLCSEASSRLGVAEQLQGLFESQPITANNRVYKEIIHFRMVRSGPGGPEAVLLPSYATEAARCVRWQSVPFMILSQSRAFVDLLFYLLILTRN